MAIDDGGEGKARRDGEGLPGRAALPVTDQTTAQHTETLGLSRSSDADWDDSARDVGDRVGPYRILKLLGKGGMGRVYLAERADGEVELQVAIKVLANRRQAHQAHQRFLAERQILAGLDHPNIARMFDAGTTEDGRSFLVMEAVDGLPVDVFCRRHRWSLNQRLELFQKVALAVGHAHQRLVVHRDLKPSNIMVDIDGNPKLLDFGIAKLLQPEDPSSELTRTGQQLMTPAWASPEQLKNEPITTATDVYALGLLLYQLLTGHLPHDSSGTLFELARRSHEEAPPRRAGERLLDPDETTRAQWPGLDPRRVGRRVVGDLDNILLKALRYDPRDRYASVEALLEDLRRLESGEPVTATRETFPYLAKKFVGRYRVPLAALAAILVLSLGFGLVTHRQSLAISEEARRTEEAKDFLAQMIGAADERSRRAGNMDLKSLLDAGLERIHSGEIDEPRIKAELLITLGKGYSDLGMYPRALAIFSEAGALLEEQEGRQTELYRLLKMKAVAFYSLGEFSSARELLERIQVSESALDAAWARRLLNRMDASQSSVAVSSEPLYQDLVEASEKLGQDPHVATVPLYWWLATRLDLGTIEQGGRFAQDLVKLGQGSEVEHLTWSFFGRHYLLSGEISKCEGPIRRGSWHTLKNRHLHDPGVALMHFSLGDCLGRLGRFEEALESIELGLGRTQEMLRSSPKDIRARYHVGLAHQIRGATLKRKGSFAEAEGELLQSKEIFEQLLPDYQEIIFIRNAYAMSLLMLGEIEAAKPLVEDLIWEGWRRPDFMNLAKEKGALPEVLPPPVAVRNELPPKLRAHLATLPEVPLPWADGQGEAPSVTEPSG